MFFFIGSDLGFLWDFLRNKIFVEATAQRNHIATAQRNHIATSPTAWFMKKNICGFDHTLNSRKLLFSSANGQGNHALCMILCSAIAIDKVQLLFFHR